MRRVSCPYDWQKLRLEDICDIQIGGTPSRNIPRYWTTDTDGYNWVAISDLGSKWITRTREQITELGVVHSNVKSVPKGTLILSFKLTIGLIAFTGGDLYTNEAIAALLPKTKELCVPWLYHTMPDVIKSHIAEQAIKGQTLNKKKLQHLVLCYPSYEEQCSISTILDTIDEQIQHTEQLIAKIKNQRAGFLHRLLTCGIDGHGHLRAPSNYNATSLQLDIKKFPKEWEIRSLGTIAEVGSGMTLNKKLSNTDAVTLPYLRVANVQDGYLDLTEVKTVSITKDDIPKYLLQPNDVLMIEGGDFDKLGRGTIWRGQISPCLHQNHVFRVRPDTRYLLPEFLTLLSGSSYGKRFFMLSSKQSTNLASINSTQLKSFPIPCPSIDEQGQILRVISEYDDDMHIEETHLEKLKVYKTGLMRDLLTGNIRIVNVSNEAEH